MKAFLRVLFPLLVVGGGVALATYFVRSRPEPRTFEAPPQVTAVEATRLKTRDFQVILDTQGTVRPRTTSVLIPEVSGRIIEISPNFRDGGFFEEGDVLVTIDPVNYMTALVLAQSGVAEAARVLEEEKARGEQAVENWRRLGKSGTPSGLVARLPQLAEAEARLLAARAEVEQAKRDLERTEVKAPFAGRILEQNVDVGQFVNSNTELGRAFATDVMEVRLPLTNRQLSFVTLPESFRDDPSAEAKTSQHTAPRVLLSGRIGREAGEWSGRIVRVDSAIDEASRQLFVVAEVDDPYRREANQGGVPLKIGMFVDGDVFGDVLEGVFVLPRQAVRINGEVILIEEDNRIRRQAVDVLWSEKDHVVIAAEGAGLAVGDVVCLTPLAYPANGAEVIPTIDGVAPSIEFPGGMPMTKGKKGGGKKGKGGGKPGSRPAEEGAAQES